MSFDGKDPLQFYLRELQTIDPLTKDEEADLLQHVQAQDEQAESAAKRLIEAHLSLVVSIAKRHSSGHLQLLDLIQSGKEGFLLAVNTFAGTSKDDFYAPAAACIETAILKAIGGSPTL